MGCFRERSWPCFIVGLIGSVGLRGTPKVGRGASSLSSLAGASSLSSLTLWVFLGQK